MADQPQSRAGDLDARWHALSDEERERLFRLAFEQAPVGAALLDEDRRFVHVNDAACRMAGYSRTEMIGITVTDLTHPDERAADLRRHERLRTGAIEENRHVKRFVGKGGDVHWADVVVRPLEVAESVPVMYLALITDVTERHRLEQELDDERQRLGRLVDNSEDAIIQGEPDGAILAANPAACRMFGRSEQELIARGRSGIVDPHDTRLTRAVHARERAGAFSGPLRFLRADGTAFTGDVVSSIYTDYHGRERTSVVIRDMSAREATHAALRESEERYRSVVAASREGLVLQALDGRILAWNDAATRIIGVAAEAIVGRSAVEREWHAIREDGSDWPASDHPSMQTLATGEPQENALMGLRRDGEVRWITVSTSPVLAAGNERPWAVAISCADVTERKKAEDALRRSEAMRDTAERVGRSGSYRWDLAMRRVAWSPGMFALFDVDPEGFDGQILPVLESRVHADDRDRVLDIGETVAVGGEGTPVELRVVHRDGSEHVLLTEFSVERDAFGAAAALTGYYRDVTDLRRAEEAIRRLSESMHAERTHGDGSGV